MAPSPAEPRLVPSILRLAWPASLSRFGVLGLMMVASALVGRVGVEELAYLAIAVAPAQVLINIGLGLIAGLPALVAQARGAGDGAAIRRLMAAGLLLSGVYGLACAALLAPGEQLLLLAHQSPGIAAGGGRCLRALAWGLPAMAMYQTVAALLEAMGRPRLPMAVIAAANLVNLALAMLLVDGHGAVGSAGVGSAGVGSAAVGGAAALSLTRWVMLALILLMALLALGRGGSRAPAAGRRRALGEILRIGAPVACAAAFETGAFLALAGFAGTLGAAALAGYQVTQTIYRIPYVPASAIGLAASIELALAQGRGARQGLARIGRVGWGMGLAFLLLFGLTLGLAAEPIGGLFTEDPAFRAALVLPVRMTAVLIVFDGSQGLLNAMLRGLRDSLIPSLAQLAAFWGVAVPLAAWFAFGRGWGLEGLILGIIAGVATATTLLALRLFLHPRLRPLPRDDVAGGLA